MYTRYYYDSRCCISARKNIQILVIILNLILLSHGAPRGPLTPGVGINEGLKPIGKLAYTFENANGNGDVRTRPQQEVVAPAPAPVPRVTTADRIITPASPPTLSQPPPPPQPPPPSSSVIGGGLFVWRIFLSGVQDSRLLFRE